MWGRDMLSRIVVDLGALSMTVWQRKILLSIESEISISMVSCLSSTMFSYNFTQSEYVGFENNKFWFN